MKNKNLLIILVVGLAVGGGVFWFVTRPKPVQEEISLDDSGTVGLANPAAVYCEEQGGTLRDELCVLPDGTECGQWDYFYGRCLGNEEGAYLVFQTADGRFSFDYPASWSRAEIDSLAALLPKDFIDKYSLTMPLLLSNPQNAQISLSTYQFEEGTDLETAMDALKEELSGMGNPYNEISREVAGDSLVEDSTVDEQGTTMRVRDILYLGQEGLVYNLSLTAPQNVWDDYESLFSYIQNSAQLSL